jgi:glycosyltransferase involved in cell wall biosynthesis
MNSSARQSTLFLKIKGLVVILILDSCWQSERWIREKNQILLLKVWARLMQTYGERTPYLILVGKYFEPSSIESNIDVVTLRWKRKDRIVHLDDVSDDELAALYQECIFTVFPSLAEGWGLPVAESLAAGKLCLASNATAIPEVGGSLLEYFDPTDAGECYRKVELYLFDSERRARAEARIRSGYRKTSLKQCAQQLRGIIAEFSAAVPMQRTPA